MDFDKFLERDMLEFLDDQARLIAEKAAGVREEEFDLYEINQDYATEISEALKNENLKKAKQIFEDVKNQYLQAANNSLSKKRLYIIMEEIYEKIKDYEEKEEGKKSLFETIKEYEEKGLFVAPTKDTGKEPEKTILPLNALGAKEKELERITTRKPFNFEDLQAAVKAYRELKDLIQKMPDSAQQEKDQMYDSAMNWYYIINKLKERLVSEGQTKPAQPAHLESKPEETSKQKLAVPEKLCFSEKKDVEHILNEVRKLKEEIVTSHMKIADYIKKRDLKNSIEEYNHLKQLCEQFPQEMEEEKTALLTDALSLYESINKLKTDVIKQGATEQAAAEEQVKDREEREKIKNEIHTKLEIIKNLFLQKNIPGAMSEYNGLRAIFDSYPEQPAEEKKQLYDLVMNAHKEMRLLEENLKRKSPYYDSDNTAAIRRILESTHALLDKGKVEEATHDLLEAKHRTELLPKEAFDDKYNLVKEIEKLEHKLTFVRNVQKIVPPKMPVDNE